MIAITVKENQGGGYPPLEAGSYRAICYSIVVLGTTYNEMFDNIQKKVMFTWELPDERIEKDGKSLPRAISATYTLSLNEKSNLRKTLETWRGKQFTADELQGFDITKVLGAPCMISTTVGSNTLGKQFSKVTAVSRLPKGMEAPKDTENPKVIFDISNEECPLEDMELLPPFVQERIRQSEEYKRRTTSNDDFIAADDEDLPFD